jgi:hypothetical protein
LLKIKRLSGHWGGGGQNRGGNPPFGSLCERKKKLLHVPNLRQKLGISGKNAPKAVFK